MRPLDASCLRPAAIDTVPAGPTSGGDGDGDGPSRGDVDSMEHDLDMLRLSTMLKAEADSDVRVPGPLDGKWQEEGGRYHLVVRRECYA